jgi:hypothetical protein
MIWGDSRVEGYNNLGAGGAYNNQSAVQTVPFMVGQALGCEVGLAAWASLGWRIAGTTNIPAFFIPGSPAGSSWNYIYSGQPRVLSGFDYLIEINLGGNDLAQGVLPANVQASVTGWIAAARAANPTAKIILVPSYEGAMASAITAGFSAAADGNSYLVTPSLSATQTAAIAGPINTGTSFLSADLIHPTVYGQQVIGSGIVKAIQAAIGVLMARPITAQ